MLLNSLSIFCIVCIMYICWYVVNTSNIVHTLFLFLTSILAYYIYLCTINKNWISLILILWHARSITVLFYLFSCFSSAGAYTNQYNYYSINSNVNLTKYLFFTSFCLASLIFLCKNYAKSLFANMRNYDISDWLDYVNPLTQLAGHQNNLTISNNTNFINVYAVISTTPSNIFLILFLLPLFLFVIYFICNYFSTRKNN